MYFIVLFREICLEHGVERTEQGYQQQTVT